jgi:hypothetical protein
VNAHKREMLMKSQKTQSKKKNPAALLFRDIFIGGKEYKTVKGKKTPFPIMTVLCAAATTVLFLILVFSLIKVSEISSEIASMKKEMITLAAKEDKLRGELDHRYSFQEIENTAAALGLSAGNGQKIILEKELTDSDPASATSKRNGKNSLLMNALYGRLRNLIKLFE